VLTSITLQNFKSFGEEQTIPLQPITVLVGPNNSGKSNLVSLARFVRNAAKRGGESALEDAGGVEFVFRRPGVGDGRMRLGWSVDEGRGSYATTLERVSSTYGGVPNGEQFALPQSGKVWSVDAGEKPNVFFKLHSLVAPWQGSAETPDAEAFRAIWRPIVTSREMKLDVSAIRRDAAVVPEPQLGDDGSGMAPVLSLWRGANFDRAGDLDALIHQCLPEINTCW
jgi:predicted ATPase